MIILKSKIATWVFIMLALVLFYSPLSAQEEGSEPRRHQTTEDGPPDSFAGLASVKDAQEGKISLDLKGVDIVELLKILSLKMNINIVPTKEVTGRVNVFLNNVDYADALDIILINNTLAADKRGNIITVMPADRYREIYGKGYYENRKSRTLQLKHASPKDVSAALEALKTERGKVIVDEASGTVVLVDVPETLDLMEKTVKAMDAPKDTEIFELRYAKAEDVKNQLASVLTPGASQIELDTRTNKIAVSDLPDKLKKIKKLITAFDDETRQVLIEAQIVQISLNEKTRFGIDWEKIFSSQQAHDVDFKGAFPISDIGSVLGEMSVGTLAADKFNLVIQALNSVAKTNILSRPRIAVVNNQEANILIGSKEVYFSQTQSQSSVTTTTAESVNYVDVGVKLSVTPTISDDGFVVMKIRPEVSSVRELATSPLDSTVPVVETSQAETTVKVRDRAMIMIAGLMKEELRNSRNQVPVLGKLPFIGWLFGSQDNQKVKTELAIFLTPRIITGDIEQVDAEKEEIKTRGVVTKRIKGRMEGIGGTYDINE